METLTLELTARPRLGKGGARQTRMASLVPVVIYGRDQEAVHYSVDSHTLTLAIGKQNRVFTLKSEDKTFDTCVTREIQRHPVTDAIEHVDFFAVKESDNIELTLPIKLTGEPIGIKQGGQMRTLMHKVNIECQVKDIPKFVEIDITNLNAGTTMLIRDVKHDVKILAPEHVAIVQITKPRAETE
jgi:large subunit ribosomal protein L25